MNSSPPRHRRDRNVERRLSRAIETAWLALQELDALWVPIIKSWRLNERMYGALTGLSKKAILGEHGEARFKQWRRGYTTRPPAASSFSPSYPGNDERYVRYLTDVRYSFRESLVRSLASGSLVLARKIPKAESLKDCMDRTIPFFTDEIYPRVVEQRKSVLVSSSENAIRGLLMHLCDIPSERIAEVEIPTGLPLVFDVKRRCLRLLDDGRYSNDPAEALARWNFGTASDLLFRPCVSDDEDDECAAELPDPVLRLAEVPAYLEDAPSPSVDDMVVGALMGEEYMGGEVSRIR